MQAPGCLCGGDKPAIGYRSLITGYYLLLYLFIIYYLLFNLTSVPAPQFSRQFPSLSIWTRPPTGFCVWNPRIDSQSRDIYEQIQEAFVLVFFASFLTLPDSVYAL
jgi:hypothetical protein